MSGDLPRTFKRVTVWLLIGAAVFVAMQWVSARQQRPNISAEAGGISLRRSVDGHFHWPGRVNGIEADFLVDTGASSTALPASLAERAGLTIDGRMRSSTAGGVVQGGLARADIVLQGGVEASRLRVAVLPDLAAPLLGMDVLSKLRFSQQGGVLQIGTIEPSPATRVLP